MVKEMNDLCKVFQIINNKVKLNPPLWFQAHFTLQSLTGKKCEFQRQSAGCPRDIQWVRSSNAVDSMPSSISFHQSSIAPSRWLPGQHGEWPRRSTQLWPYFSLQWVWSPTPQWPSFQWPSAFLLCPSYMTLDQVRPLSLGLHSGSYRLLMRFRRDPLWDRVGE